MAWAMGQNSCIIPELPCLANHIQFTLVCRVADSRSQASARAPFPSPPTPCPGMQRSQKLGRVEEERRDPPKCREQPGSCADPLSVSHLCWGRCYASCPQQCMEMSRDNSCAGWSAGIRGVGCSTSLTLTVALFVTSLLMFPEMAWTNGANIPT